jgi:hypothetical protein
MVIYEKTNKKGIKIVESNFFYFKFFKFDKLNIILASLLSYIILNFAFQLAIPIVQLGCQEQSHWLGDRF